MTSPSIDSAVAELRAFLTLDMDLHRRLSEAQDADGRRAFAAVLTIAFTRAAEKRFGERPAADDMISFVADARARTVGPSCPPEDAEKVLRGVLGEEELLASVDMRARGAAQNAMLFAITHENDKAPAQIDGLLAQAAEEAEAYFRNRAAR
jgi:hypothetical protein